MEASYYIRVILTLGVLIACLILLQRLTKGLYKKRFSGDIKILDRLPIDSNSSLVYIDCQKTRLLIGLNAKQIQVLHTWNNKVSDSNNGDAEESRDSSMDTMASNQLDNNQHAVSVDKGNNHETS